MGEGEIVRVSDLIEELTKFNRDPVLIGWIGTHDSPVDQVQADEDVGFDDDMIVIDTRSVSNGTGGSETHLVLRRPYL